MIEKKPVASLDLDGVLFPRIPVQLAVFQPWGWNKPLKPGSQIFMADRIPQDHPLSSRQRAELQGHAKRFVKPNMPEIIKRIQADIKIGNTGRPNYRGMVDMTWERLRQGEIANEFKYINFKPEGVSPDESKYWGLVELINKGYVNITHFDDNAITIKRLAKLLPLVQFVIVQDLTSGILFSKLEMRKYPNVTRTAEFKSQK